MNRIMVMVAVLALWSAQAFAEEGNYVLGPIEDAPIEIDVPEVSQDDRPAGVPDGAPMRMFYLGSVGPDIIDLRPDQTYLLLYGVDAPEAGYRPEHLQPFAIKAVNALRYMLGSGMEADDKGAAYVVNKGWAMRKGSGTGRYVQLYHATEGYDINASLICAGLAWWDRERAPDSKILSDCEAEARAAKRGIWSEENPIPPWDWRKGVRE